MALQFQPPPDWLVQEYMNRKHPIAQAAEGAQNVLGTYMTLQNQQDTQAIRQRQMKLLEQKQVLEEQKNTREQGQYAREYAPAELPGAGGAYNQYSTSDMGQAQGQTLTQDAQMRSMLTQEQGAGAPSLGPTAGSGSLLIDHWNSSMGANQGIGMAQNTNLAPTPKNPQEEANLGFANRFPFGLKGDHKSLDQKRTYSPATFLNENDEPVMGRFDTRNGIPEIQDENGEWVPAPPGTVRGYSPSYGIDPALGGLQKRTARGVSPVSTPTAEGDGNDVVNLRKKAPKLADRFDELLNETSPEKNTALRTSIDAASSANQVRGILKDPNPSQVGLQSLGFYLARMSGSNSQLSDAEREVFQEPLSLVDKVVNKGYKIVAGDLSPTMRKDLLHLSETIGRKAHLQGSKYIENQKMKSRQALGSYYTPGLDKSFPTMDSLSVSSEEMLGGGKGAGAKAPAISSKAQYDALPSGSPYIWNGREGKKP